MLILICEAKQAAALQAAALINRDYPIQLQFLQIEFLRKCEEELICLTSYIIDDILISVREVQHKKEENEMKEMKPMVFKSIAQFDEYDMVDPEIPIVIWNGWSFQADVEIPCEQWREAMIKFHNALTSDFERQISGWTTIIWESCKKGIFSGSEKTSPKDGCYSWSLYKSEYGWHIILNLSGKYVGK